MQCKTYTQQGAPAPSAGGAQLMHDPSHLLELLPQSQPPALEAPLAAVRVTSCPQEAPVAPAWLENTAFGLNIGFVLITVFILYRHFEERRRRALV